MPEFVMAGIHRVSRETPAARAAASSFPSSVARGRRSRALRARYAASYTVRRYCRANSMIRASSPGSSIEILSRRRSRRISSDRSGVFRPRLSFMIKIFLTSYHQIEGTSAEPNCSSWNTSSASGWSSSWRDQAKVMEASRTKRTTICALRLASPESPRLRTT